MTLTVDVAVEQERTSRKERAMQKFAELVVNGEAEIARLEGKIAKIRKEIEAIPNFDDPVVVSDFIQRYH